MEQPPKNADDSALTEARDQQPETSGSEPEQHYVPPLAVRFSDPNQHEPDHTHSWTEWESEEEPELPVTVSSLPGFAIGISVDPPLDIEDTFQDDEPAEEIFPDSYTHYFDDAAEG